MTHLLRDRLLRALASAQLLAALSAGATSALLVVYAREALEVTGSGYGALLVSLGLGAVLAEAIGISAVYALGGVLLLLAAAVGFLGSRGAT